MKSLSLLDLMRQSQRREMDLAQEAFNAGDEARASHHEWKAERIRDQVHGIEKRQRYGNINPASLLTVKSRVSLKYLGRARKRRSRGVLA